MSKKKKKKEEYRYLKKKTRIYLFVLGLLMSALGLACINYFYREVIFSIIAVLAVSFFFFSFYGKVLNDNQSLSEKIKTSLEDSVLMNIFDIFK